MIRVEFIPDSVASPLDGYGASAYIYNPKQWRAALSEARYRRGRGELVSVKRIDQ